MMKIKIEEIKQVFHDEFAPVYSKFDIIDLPITQFNNFHESADRPGVYVYWKEDRVIKVGRHLVKGTEGGQVFFLL
jgi:hypothetical protein